MMIEILGASIALPAMLRSVVHIGITQLTEKGQVIIWVLSVLFG
jgi:hypothetical protein